MSRYARINSTLWSRSGKWRKLQDGPPDDYIDPRTLYFYLHSSPHGTPGLCYRLSVGAAADDLNCTPTACRHGLDTLSAAGLVVYSEAEKVVYVVGSVLQDPPNNVSHAKGMLTPLFDLEQCDAMSSCISDLQSHEKAEEWMKDEAYRHLVDTLSTPSRQGGGDPVEPRTPSPSPTPVPQTTGDRHAGAREADPPDPPEPDPPHIGQRLTDLWREHGLQGPRGYDWLQAAVKVSSLTQHFDDDEILAAPAKIATTPGLSWVAKKGPAYLAERIKGGILVLQVVLDWEDRPKPNGRPAPTTGKTYSRDPKDWQ